MERLDDQSVDLVYLDPPWFTMGDVSAVSKDQYKNFIYKVLQQAQRVLKRSGNIFMYSRPDLNLDFGTLLAEVFGVENHVAEFVIPTKRPTNRGTESVHETLFFYRISEEHVNNRIYRNNEEDIMKLFPMTDLKGHYTYFSLFGRARNGLPNFEWNGMMPPQRLSWRFSRERLDEMLNEGLIISKHDKLYQKKYYTSEDQLFPIGTIWDDIPYISSGIRIPGSQNVKLMERIYQIGSNENQIVLDPFCGSGPSIEACVNLKRNLIACDTNVDAIAACKQRLMDKFPEINYSFFEEDDILRMQLVWDNYEYVREEDQIIDMISKGENSLVEFKESLCWNYFLSKKEAGLAVNVVRTIASFLNTFGGVLLIGVKNDGSLIDLKPDFDAADPQKRNRDGYELFLNNKIKEFLGVHSTQKYKISFYKIRDSEVCKIVVDKSKDPVFLNKEFYIRANNQTVMLNIPEFYTYIMSRLEREQSTLNLHA